MASTGDNLSPPGSSSYTSNTLHVGDGTWDATRDDFLLPNLVGLNFDTMRYNGMGNRFAGETDYHNIIRGHAICAAITFLVLVPFGIMSARFNWRNGRRYHIYFQIVALAMVTVAFVLGWIAVGPSRSLTNPHHGIGLAIYVLFLVQALLGAWIRTKRHRNSRGWVTIKAMLHHWLGRATALLGIVQVPLGLTLYGSPKFTFVLYTLWMTFLLVLYFILQHRRPSTEADYLRGSVNEVEVIEERKTSRFGGLIAPLAAGAGAAALLGRNRNRSRSRSRSRSRREEVIPSRRGSGSYIEEEKYESRRKDSGGGFLNAAFKIGAVLGAGALAKSWYDRRKRKNDDGSDYSSVAPDTPTRRHRRHNESEISEETVEVHRMEEGRTGLAPAAIGGAALGGAALAAAASNSRPARLTKSHGRPPSYTATGSSYSSELSPSRRPQESHNVRNGILAGVGLGWLAKRFKDRRDQKERDRLDALEEEHRIEDEKLARAGRHGSRYTGDGYPSPSRRQNQRPPPPHVESSDLSSVLDDPHVRPGASIPPIPAALGGVAAGALAGAALSSQPRSRHDTAETVTMPPAPPDPQGILYHDSESGSEAYISPGGHPHRRRSARRRREGDAAAAVAVAEAAALAAEVEHRRRDRSRNDSRDHFQGVASPPVGVKVKMHGGDEGKVTIRRLTEQEAAARQEARRSERRSRRDSASSLSATDTGASSRYRRDRRERRDAQELDAGPMSPQGSIPPDMAPLSPPNPAFAAGRRPKDSAYYSGRPPVSHGGSVNTLGSPESHGTWSGMSPGDSSLDANERRRRRRLERNQRQGGGSGPSGSVDYQ